MYLKVSQIENSTILQFSYAYFGRQIVPPISSKISSPSPMKILTIYARFKTFVLKKYLMK